MCQSVNCPLHILSDQRKLDDSIVVKGRPVELVEMILSYLIWVNPGGADTEQEVGEPPHLSPEAEPLAWEAAYEFLSVPTYEELEQWTVEKVSQSP